MSTKPKLAFDVCWEVYRGARERLESKDTATAFQFIPEAHPAKLREYVADFAVAGRDALAGPELAARAVLFRLYYLGLEPYKHAKYFIGLSERGWVNWTDDIRERVGRQLLKRGMFPPRRYITTGGEDGGKA